MVDINWQIFQAKFHEKTTNAFERFAYMLFCFEFDNKKGIFRFKNQAGIETEPIEHNGEYIGFQAKFYTTPLADNKDDIIDALTKAKGKNSQLTQVLVYTNQELSESSKRAQKKPQYQIHIENAAESLGVTVKWRVQSHFERQLAFPENHYLASYFFTFDKNITDTLDVVLSHTKNLLFTIQDDISFEGRQLRIDRSQIAHSISEAAEPVIILTGEGGCGKTAIIKQLFQSAIAPFYVFKAAEFKRDSLDLVLGLGDGYHLNDFLTAHDKEPVKTVVIDSAERLAEIEQLDVFKEFLAAFIAHSWRIIFTTRNIYLDDLCFQVSETLCLAYKIERVPNLSIEHLEDLATKYCFQLPRNERFQILLANLFYLHQYLHHYRDLNVEADLANFREMLWQQKVQNSRYKQDNMHLQRQQCFLTLVDQRCRTGNYYLIVDGCDPRVLALLVKDEIIGYDEAFDRHFITHDIYEEWALERRIGHAFREQSATLPFFQHIGESLPVRRAFRNWLSGRMSILDAEINDFVKWAFQSEEVVQFWKDELIVSILLGDYCTSFFQSFDHVLLENKKVYLKRILFLLRIACISVDETSQKRLMTSDGKVNPKYFFTKPKGPGWSVAITYIHKKREHFSGDELSYLLPVWKEWVNNHPKGDVTRAVGQSALHFYKKVEVEEEIYLNKESTDALVKIILSACNELKSEMTEILHGFSQGTYTRHVPMGEMRDAILEASYESITVINTLPIEVISLLKNAWYQAPESRHEFDFGGMGTEIHYGIRSQFASGYSPPSALQTPIFFLLTNDFWSTVTFLLDTVNKMVETFAASKFDASVYETELTIDGKVIKQWISGDLWCLYRGSGKIVTPYLLQSVHMALEKFLLESAPHTTTETLEEIIIYLIQHSRSASITAIASSIVQAFPYRCFNVARILFTNRHFLRTDNIRRTFESRVRSLYSIGGAYGYLKKQYADERMETLDQPHRRLTLENLMVNYQIFSNEGDTTAIIDQRQQQVWETIDQLKSQILLLDADSDEGKAARILVTRIDSRNFNLKIEETTQGTLVHLNPNLESDLKEYSEGGMKEHRELYKYTELSNWAHRKFDKRGDLAEDPQFDGHPEEVMRQMREIVERIKKEDGRIFKMYGMLPAYGASALIKEYAQKLSAEDFEFCKDILISYAGQPLAENYDYQIGDGVEVAVSTLPYLLDFSPDDANDIFLIMLFLLFDEYPIGAYKRICQYVIEAIEHRLIPEHPQLADKIMVSYLLWNEKFVLYHREKRDKKLSVSRFQIIKEFCELYENEILATEGIVEVLDLISFTDLSYRTASNAVEMIPADSESTLHLVVMRKFLKKAFPWVIQETSYKDENSSEYHIKHAFFKKYAAFLLFRQPERVTEWLQPFLDKFSLSDESASLIAELVSAEIFNKRYQHFWAIWEAIYPVAKTASTSASKRYLRGVWTNYMLAWQWWETGTQEWYSLRLENAPFFERITQDLGHLPEVFYSIAKLLNQIGAQFLPQGIKWIAAMLSRHKDHYEKADLEDNTIYYLEVLIRKYCYDNRTNIKQQASIKQQVMVILDFLVNRGAVTGYLLREELM